MCGLLNCFDVFAVSEHVRIFPSRVVLFLTFHCALSLLQVWPLTPGIWTTTHQCSRRLKGTLPAWSVSTWLNPTGEAHWDYGLWRSCVWISRIWVWVLSFPDISAVYSEHSRHWFFRGRMVIDGQEQKETLFSLIMDTQRHSNQNNVIKFCDNSRLGQQQPLAVCFCSVGLSQTRVCPVQSKE